MSENIPQNSGPTAEQIQEAASVLNGLEPGFLPGPIFEQVTRLCVTPIVEVVPLRTSPTGNTEVLLLKRDDDDPNWPGMLHTPGTVLRATDLNNGIDGAINRIFRDELKIETPPTVFVTSFFHKVKRGAEIASVYYADLNELEVVGDWHPVANLPGTIVDTQIEFINRAAEKFNKEVNNG